MRLTRETEHAIRALSVLARRPADTVPVHELAASEQLPPRFLAKTFQRLARCGILRSARGAGKGYTLSAAPETITLIQIVEAVQGTDYLDQCVFWSGRCGSATPCLLHERFLSIKPMLRQLFEGTTLADLAGLAERETGDGEAADVASEGGAGSTSPEVTSS